MLFVQSNSHMEQPIYQARLKIALPIFHSKKQIDVPDSCQISHGTLYGLDLIVTTF